MKTLILHPLIEELLLRKHPGLALKRVDRNFLTNKNRKRVKDNVMEYF